MAIVYLSLGSNKDDRIGYIQQASRQLGALEGCEIIRTSAFYETEPWNMNSDNWFVNAVVELKTSLSPHQLLEQCQAIEKQLGRKPSQPNVYEDRTIDIDILFYKKEIISDDDLIIPHRFLHLRAFTLVPLLELIPDFEHPVLHKTISELHDSLETPEMVILYGTRL